MTQNQRDMRLVSVQLSVAEIELLKNTLLSAPFYGTKADTDVVNKLNLALQPQPPAQGEAQALLTDEEIKPFADELHPHSWSKQELGIVRKIAQAQLAKAMTILEQRVLDAVKAEYVSWHPEYTHRRDEPEQFIEAVRQRLSRPQGEYRLPEQNAGIKHPSITPAQPAPTVAPAGGEVSWCVCGHDQQLHTLTRTRIHLGKCNGFQCSCEYFKAEVQPATPQGQGDARDTLLTDDEIDSAYEGLERLSGVLKAQDAKTRRILATQPHVQSPTVEQVRPVVTWFAEQMEATLKQNDHKGGWQDMSFSQLIRRLYEEVRELQGTDWTFPTPDYNAVIKEATDVANFAMFIADVANRKVGNAIREAQ